MNTQDQPRAWLVRTGSTGDLDEWALESSQVFIGFEIGDVSGCTSRDDVVSMYMSAYPDTNPKAALNWAAQVWAFAGRIEIGDLAVLPLKRRGQIAIGRVSGSYKYDADAPAGRRHTRTVEWMRTDLSRGNVEQDLLYSLGAFLTVCQVTRHDAARRLLVSAETGVDPGDPTQPEQTVDSVPSDATPEAIPQDLAEAARDKITAFVHKTFARHSMEGLVADILTAEGFVCETHGPGTDRGIDIIAGSGPLGLDAPRLLVQVKSSKDPVGSEVFQQLSGNIADHHGADQGLLVAWGGLTRQAKELAQPQRFRIRVWTAKDVVDALLNAYPRLPERLRLQIPLTQVWVLEDEAIDG